MKVTLIDYTRDAAVLLAFTKNTRLLMTPGTLDDIKCWPPERIRKELTYIARTIRSSHEFVSYTFLIERVSRAFTHQFVRTRTGSYAQQSMRVTDMSQFDFVWPQRLLQDRQELRCCVEHALETVREAYQDLVNAGVATEDARSILPTNIATNIVAKFNLRNFADLVTSRLGGRTQGEYRRVAEAMVEAVLEVHPWAHDFIFRDFDRDHFAEIEAFAEEEFGGDLARKGKLLKIVDAMRGVK